MEKQNEKRRLRDGLRSQEKQSETRIKEILDELRSSQSRYDPFDGLDEGPDEALTRVCLKIAEECRDIAAVAELISHLNRSHRTNEALACLGLLVCLRSVFGKGMAQNMAELTSYLPGQPIYNALDLAKSWDFVNADGVEKCSATKAKQKLNR